MNRVVFTLFAFVFINLAVFADIIPNSVSDIPQGSIGLYQTNSGLTTYVNANKTSPVSYNKSWSYLSVSSSDFVDHLFAVLIDKKELSFVYVNDIDEDFVQVIYNKKTRDSGWAYKEDDFQFLPWITFFNMYGKKYGLKLLKGYPSNMLSLHSKSDDNSQIVEKLIRPRNIRLTTIQGNWALITALDVDGKAKTGYMRWRSDEGSLLMFPALK